MSLTPFTSSIPPSAVSATSAVGIPASSSLPVISQARAPQWVRDGSAATKQAYATAQGFEEMLVNELSQSLVQGSGLEGEGSEAASGEGSSGDGGQGGTSDAGAGLLSSMLPQAFGEGVMREGGLGLAAELTPALERSAAAAAAGAPHTVTTGTPVSGPAPSAAVSGSGGTRA